MKTKLMQSLVNQFIFTGMVNAAGIKLMDVDNLKLNLLDPVAEQAMQSITSDW